jgi:hypothetical protein
VSVINDRIADLITVCAELRDRHTTARRDGDHTMKSVFRLAARRTSLCEVAPKPGAAPVSEKRIGLNRSPRRRGYGL